MVTRRKVRCACRLAFTFVEQLLPRARDSCRRANRKLSHSCEDRASRSLSPLWLPMLSILFHFHGRDEPSAPDRGPSLRGGPVAPVLAHLLPWRRSRKSIGSNFFLLHSHRSHCHYSQGETIG